MTQFSYSVRGGREGYLLDDLRGLRQGASTRIALRSKKWPRLHSAGPTAPICRNPTELIGVRPSLDSKVLDCRNSAVRSDSLSVSVQNPNETSKFSSPLFSSLHSSLTIRWLMMGICSWQFSTAVSILSKWSSINLENSSRKHYKINVNVERTRSLCSLRYALE